MRIILWHMITKYRCWQEYEEMKDVTVILKRWYTKRNSLDIKALVIGNGHGNQSSNPWRGC